MPLPEQEPAFTVYDDIRQKLIAHGMPADQIAFIPVSYTHLDVYKRQSMALADALMPCPAQHTAAKITMGKDCTIKSLSLIHI